MDNTFSYNPIVSPYVPGVAMGAGLGPSVQPMAQPYVNQLMQQPVATTEKGEFSKGVARGIDQAQMLGFAGLAALADTATPESGVNIVRDWALSQASNQAEQMAENPAKVAQFTDINFDNLEGIDDAYNWFTGTVGEMLPTSAVIAVVSLFTGLGGGAATSLATQPTIRAVIARSIASNMAKGMSEKAATASALRVAGAYAGGFTGSTLMETGSNYLDDIEQNTLSGASGARALGYGALGGLLEVGLGPEAGLARKALSGAPINNAIRGGIKGFGRSLAKGAGEGALKEAGTEGGQEILNIMAAKGDPTNQVERIFNAAMAGVAGGIIPGAGEGFVSYAKSPKLTAKSVDISAPETTKSTVKQNFESAQASMKNEVDKTEQTFVSKEQQLKQRQQQLMQLSMDLNTIQDATEKEQKIKTVDNELLSIAGQLSALSTQKEQYIEGAKKEAQKMYSKFNKEYAEAVDDEPSSPLLQIDKNKKQIAGHKLLEDHVNNEIDKAQLRIMQHEIAKKYLDKDSANGSVWSGPNQGFNDIETIRWHEKQIQDEHKFIDNLTKQFEEAVIANRKVTAEPYVAAAAAQKLFDMSRARSFAGDSIQELYSKRRESAEKKATSLLKEEKLNEEENWYRRYTGPSSMYDKLAKLREARNLKKTALRDKMASDIAIAASLKSDANAMRDLRNKIQQQEYLKWLSGQSPTFNFNQSSVQARIEQARRDKLIRKDINAGLESTVLPGTANTITAINQLAGQTVPAEGTVRIPVLPESLNNSSDIVRRGVASGTNILGDSTPFVKPGEPRGVIVGGFKPATEMRIDTLERQRLIEELKLKENQKFMDEHTKQQAKNIEAVNRVTSWISNTLDQLPAIKNRIVVTYSSNILNLPKAVQLAYKNNAAIIDLNDGKIYLFADKIYNKTHAIRKVLHESVAHFGLRALMNPTQMESFLNLIATNFTEYKAWKEIANKYPEYNSMELAEEFAAALAERIRVNPETMVKAASVFEKVKQFIKNLLQDLGLIKPTIKDVENVLLASVYNLTKPNIKFKGAANRVLESREIAQENIWAHVYKTPAYNKKFGWLKNFKSQLLKSPTKVTSAGKVHFTNPTFLDKVIERVADSQYWLKRTVDAVKDAGGTVSESSNAYREEELVSNRINSALIDFNEDLVGININDPTAPAAEGTLLHEAAKLINGKKITDRNLLKVLGLVTYANHAPEANAVLRDRARNNKIVRRLERTVSVITEQLNSDNLTAADIVELETQLAQAEEKLAAANRTFLGDAPSGMSDRRAAKIMSIYVTPENALQWESVFNKVKEINRFTLQQLVDAKLLSNEQKNAWEKLYPNYVPLKEWEAMMASRDPGYVQWAAGRSYSMSTWVASKIRKGRTSVASNPIVQLIRKGEDSIRVSRASDVVKALIQLVEDNPETTSMLMQLDKQPQEIAVREQLKSLLNKAESYLPADKITNIRSLLKQYSKVKKEITEKLRLWKNIEAARKSDSGKTNAAARVNKLTEDLQNVTDAIDAVKQQRDALKNNSDYIEIQQQIAATKQELKKLISERGYKLVSTPDGIKRRVRTRMFEGITNTQRGANTGVITGFDKNGVRRRMWVKSPFLLAALQGSNSIMLHPVLKFLAKINMYMARMFTTWNPEFIFTNVARDLETAWIHIRNTAEDVSKLHLTGNELVSSLRKNYLTAAKQVWLSERGRIADMDSSWRHLVEKYKKYGGYTTMFQTGDFNTTVNNIKKSISATVNTDVKTRAKKFGFSALKYIDDGATAFENATRLSAFKVVAETLIDNGVDAEKAYKRAANVALNLTVNFSKRGSWGPMLSSMYLFANASIQSTVRMMRAMFPHSDRAKPVYKRRFVRYAGGIMGLSIITGVLGRLLGGNDKDGISYYDKIPEWTRGTNLIFMIPGTEGKYIKVPFAYGYQVFWTSGQALSDVIFSRTNPADVIRRVFDSVITNFSPLGDTDEGWTTLLPAQIKPLIQIEANRNYFGKPIFPEQKSWEKGEKPDSQKYWSDTSQLLVAITEALNSMTMGSKDRSGLIDVSPASIEYLIQQYSGGLGKTIIDSAEVAIDALFGKMDQIKVSDIPMVRRFSGEKSAYSTMSEYSKIKLEIETQLNEFKTAKENRLTGEDFAKIAKNTASARLLEKQLSQVQQKLKDLSSQERKYEKVTKDIRARVNLQERFATARENVMLQFIKKAKMAGI